MRLTILHVPDCPNVATLAERLTEVLAGRGDINVERRVVDSEWAAWELGMTGSPTLLVDGRDPFAEPDREASVSCRLYREESGRVSGAPSVDQLRRALEATPPTPRVTNALLGTQHTGDQLSCCSPAPGQSRPASNLEDRRARTAPLGPAGRAVHRQILRAFATTGRPPDAEELDRIAAVHDMTAQQVLAGLHTADVIRLDPSGLIGVAYPFSANPTRHRVRLAGGVHVWAMCAVDALGMAAMLDTDAMITSTDPANGRPVTVTVHDGHYSWDPGTAVMFLSAAAGDGPSAESCCNDLNFFITPASAHAWSDARAQLRGEILDAATAEDLGRRIFGALLRPDEDDLTAP